MYLTNMFFIRFYEQIWTVLRTLKMKLRHQSVCGHDLQLKQQVIALKAAHIKWFQAGGPDVEQNGLALASREVQVFKNPGYASLYGRAPRCPYATCVYT